MVKESREWGSSLVASVLALCAMSMAVPGHAAVGRTAGSLNVNNVGAATYQVPIFAPPGPGGLQPSVALAYSSNGGRGIVGRFWSLAGFSSIHPCAPNDALDGYRGPIRHDGLYCLNGNRLRKVSGTYGAAGSVYMTEMADFSRATLSGSPLSWEVKGKDGLIYTYGGTDDSRVTSSIWSSTILEWKLSEIRDRNNNRVLFIYENQHPDKIEWTQTGHNSGSYVNVMEFTYEPDGNAEASTHVEAVEGVEVNHDTDLLTAITIKVSGTAERKYLLEYEDSPTTGAKRLETVTECDGAGTDCLAPTTFTYQDGAYGTQSTASLSVPYYTTDASGDYDFNGDGIRDIAYTVDNVCYVRLGSKSSTTYGQQYTIGEAGWVMAGKLKGNTQDQLLAGSSSTWHVYDWNGSGFTAASTGLTYAATAGHIVVADLDGDRLDDLAYVTGWSSDLVGTAYSSTPHVYLPHVDMVTRRNITTSGTVAFNSPVSTPWVWPTEYTAPPWWTAEGMEFHYFFNYIGFYALPSNVRLIRGGDLDGDGAQELNLTIEASVGFYPLSGNVGDGTETSNGWTTFIVKFQGGYADVLKLREGETWIEATLIATDFNNDGCDDYVAVYDYVNYTGFSSCTWGGLSPEHPIFKAAGYREEIGPYEGAADLDGDGRQDYLTGTGNFHIRTDGNGDGLDDVGVLVPWTSFTVYDHASSLVPDLLAQVEDGFGVTQTLEYASIARSNYTEGSSSTFPYRQLKRPLHVVSKVTSSDGIGGTYDTTYHYTGAVTSLGRGSFFGFEKIESEDSRSGIQHERQFELTEPYMGMLKVEKFSQPAGAGGHVISEKTMTFATHTLDATTWNQRRFPYVSGITEKVYEVGSGNNLITETVVSNTYDTSGNLTASTSTVTDKDSSSNPNYLHYWTTAFSVTITPDTTSNWCLGLPTASSVVRSSSVSGESTVTQSKTFDPDYVNCRMDAESVGSGNLKVTTGYEYDEFGNVDKVTVTGRNLDDTDDMDDRVTETTWGSADGTTGGTGVFPVSVKNPLNQISTRTFDPTFGSLLTEYDPNGIRVAYKEYDSFGRLTLDKRADDTSTLYSYTACDSNCRSDEDRMRITASERNTSGTEFRNSYTHVDMLGRTWLTDVQNFSGGYTRQWQQFDEQGRVEYQGIPCDASSCTPVPSSPPADNAITNFYDLVGRLISQSRPQNDSSSTPVETTFAYAGRTQTITDPNGKDTIKVMDVNGWMRQSRDDDGYGQDFSYDAAGSLLEVADNLSPSNTLFTAEYEYGIKPFQVATTDMDLGHWEYTYNSLGELVSWTDANGESFSQTYDALSRLLTRIEYEGTTTWTWDVNTDSGCGSYDIGRLFKVSMTGYEEKYCYDPKGRPAKQTITADQAYDIDYSYTNRGQLYSLTYPTSTSSTRVHIKYGYTSAGFLQTVEDWTSGSLDKTYWTADTRNLRGQTTKETLGNGVVTERNYDAVTGWLNWIHSGTGGTYALQNLTYGYDSIGNVTQRMEGNLNVVENFCYDNLYRLLKTQLGSSPSASCASPTLTFTYDASGNITSQTGVGSYDYITAQSGCSYYSHTQRHAVRSAGGKVYCYDANGNMISRDGEDIEWTTYNYPKRLTTATEETLFKYGPDRQYYQQDYTGPGVTETTRYIGGILEKVCAVADCLSGTVDWRHYIQAEGQVVAIISRKSTGGTPIVSYPLEDNQGSGSTLADSSGGVLARQSYEPFGKQRDGGDWVGPESSGDLSTMESISRRGYTTHSMLGRMDLIHMNGRVQDAVTGRFLSADPTIPNPGFTQSYNRYAYVNNNPATYTDPSGFTPIAVQALLLSGVAMCDNPNAAAMAAEGGFQTPNQDQCNQLYDYLVWVLEGSTDPQAEWICQYAPDVCSQSNSKLVSRGAAISGVAIPAAEGGAALGDLIAAGGRALAAVGRALVAMVSEAALPVTLALAPTKLGNGELGGVFYHGTSSFFGGSLDPIAASAFSNNFASLSGFYLATDPATAAHFAAVAEETTGSAGFVLTYYLSQRAMAGLEAAGAVLGPVPGGPSRYAPPFPGLEFYIPVTAFPAFNAFLGSGDIRILPPGKR